MAILGIILFSVAFAVALWAMAITIAPRWQRIVALLDGSAFAAPPLPVAHRRVVRRLQVSRIPAREWRAAA